MEDQSRVTGPKGSLAFLANDGIDVTERGFMPELAAIHDWPDFGDDGWDVGLQFIGFRGAQR
jgi:hypothetical protein